MNRLAILAASVTAFGVGKFVADPPVNLQASSPGTQQTGNINVSGTVLAGTFYGSSGGSTTKVVSGWATSPTGFVFGGDFRTNSTDGRGIFASALAPTGSTYGGDFRSASTTGRGIFGYATATTGQAIGGDFRSDASSGTGIFGRAMSTTGNNVGGHFSSASNSGTGIIAESTSPTGDNYAAVFDSSTTSAISSTALIRANGGGSSGATALRALITSSNGGQARAIYGDGRAGYGAYFIALGAGGYGASMQGDERGASVHSTSGFGIRVDTANKDSYGVYSTAPTGGNGNAIFASGTFAASGTKALKIDHPDDPENKYLQQFCAEGDTPQLQYRGVVKLDASGAATVQLPAYFDKINRDPIYQLTAIGAAMPNLHVSHEEVDNQFQIAGGKAGAKVCWLVIGIRNDRFMQKYGAAAELDKSDENKGTYLMPELYNKGEELRQGFNPKDDIVRSAPPVAGVQNRHQRSATRSR